MFDEFEPFDIKTQDDPPVAIHGLKSNTSAQELPPLLLIHGFPQSHHIWHRVAPQLTSQYNVILIDIRGYGASSKPGDLASYAKSAMARDCIAVMDALGYASKPFFVCAHDRGARVAHKLCVDFPDRVHAAIFLDICPTLAMYEATNLDFAKAYFHWFFLIQAEPLPETLINANSRRFTELFMGGRQNDGLSIFEPECFEYYASILEDPAAVHAMCQDYRAAASLDLDEAREDLKNGDLIKCPLKILWGKHGVIEKCFNAVKDWKAVTDPGVTVEGNSTESGHYVPEQAPTEVIDAIRGFLK